MLPPARDALWARGAWLPLLCDGTRAVARGLQIIPPKVVISFFGLFGNKIFFLFLVHGKNIIHRMRHGKRRKIGNKKK